MHRASTTDSAATVRVSCGAAALVGAAAPVDLLHSASKNCKTHAKLLSSSELVLQLLETCPLRYRSLADLPPQVPFTGRRIALPQQSGV
jgi:hypothetical protein